MKKRLVSFHFGENRNDTKKLLFADAFLGTWVVFNEAKLLKKKKNPKIAIAILILCFLVIIDFIFLNVSPHIFICPI